MKSVLITLVAAIFALNSNIANAVCANVTVTGTTSTWMPCSQTSCLNERFFEAQVNAVLACYDANGKRQDYNVTASGKFEMPAGSGNGFSFHMPVCHDACASVIGISANGMVQPVVGYGIHGVFLFWYTGFGTTPGANLTVNTVRTGQKILISGMSELYGLIPNYEDRPGATTVPQPPPPPTPPNCYRTFYRDGGSGILGWWTRGDTFDYNTSAGQCSANGSYIPSAAELLADSGSLALPGGCIWTSTMNSFGQRLTYTPGVGISSTNSGPCHTICRMIGCGSTAPALAPAPAGNIQLNPLPVQDAVAVPVE